jgi:hypothetical protein
MEHSVTISHNYIFEADYQAIEFAADVRRFLEHEAELHRSTFQNLHDPASYKPPVMGSVTRFGRTVVVNDAAYGASRVCFQSSLRS